MDDSPNQRAEILDAIWKDIWVKRPILGEIMEKHGSQKLYDYTKDFFDINPSPFTDPRKGELYEVVRDLLTHRLGAEVANGVVRQLEKLPLVSTTDHHSPVAHPFFLNSNIVSGIGYMESEDVDLRYLIVFSFASLSINSESGYSRGIVFRGGYSGNGSLVKLNFYLDREKMAVIYGYRPFNQEDLLRAQTLLDQKVREGEVLPEKAAGVRAILDQYFAHPDVLNASDLSEQITRLNYQMWPQLFHPVEEKVPDLIYLDIETLVREVLLRKHFDRPDSLLYRMLFDPKLWELSLKHFNGIPGAFSVEKDWGSFLFWALDEENRRVRLKLDQGVLRSPDGKYEFELTPDSIRHALEKKQIFPSMFLCYFVVALYYGMKCLGGFCQVSDLTQTKRAWQDLLRELNMNEEADALEVLQTKELGGDGMLLAYSRNDQGDLVAPFGIDMMLEKTETRFEDYVEHTKILTFRDMMNPLVLEIYKVLFGFDERKPEYNVLTTDAVLSLTGLKEKLIDWECLS